MSDRSKTKPPADEGRLDRRVRRGFWPGFLDGLAMGPMWRWLACRVGLHRWWHLDVQRGDERLNLCCTCGRTRPARD